MHSANETWDGAGRLPRTLVRAAWLVLWCGLAGCHLLDRFESPDSAPPVAPGKPEESQPPAVTKVEVDPQLLAEFREWLDQDAWQLDMHWNVTDPARVPSRPWRWLYLPGDALDKSAATKASAKSAVADVAGPRDPHPSVRWQWVWSGQPERADSSELTAARAVLQQLSGESGRIGDQAVILLARLQPAEVLPAHRTRLEQLTQGSLEATRPSQSAVIQRAAATEAWCAVLRTESEQPSIALAPIGQLLLRPGLPDEIRITAWHSLAHSLPPDQLPQLTEAIKPRTENTPTATALRRAAMEACVIHAAAKAELEQRFDANNWPPFIDTCRHDPDPRIRILFGRWAGIAQSPSAIGWLTGQLRDTEPQVRDAALLSLGRLTSPEAKIALSEFARKESGRARALTVTALARWGIEEVLPYRADSHQEVRIAVARGLAQHRTAASAQELRSMFSDPHPDVQAAVLSAAQTWPEPWKTGLLLEAVRVGSLATRKAASYVLREQNAQLTELPIEAAPAERDLAVRDAARTLGVTLELWSSSLPTVVYPDHGTPEAVSPASQVLLELREATTGTTEFHAAWDRLLQLSPNDVTTLERSLETPPEHPHRTAIVRDALPRLSPGYAALRDLAATDLQLRRKAARNLQTAAETTPLTSGMLRQLAEQLTQEQDQLVWQSCLAALKADGSPDAQPIMLLALHHTWPDVRRLGVELVERYPTAEAASWLLPLLRDSHPGVRLAAIAAIGKCSNPMAIEGFPAQGTTPAVPGLRSLLSDTDEEVRLTALMSLARLRDESACEELVRLTYHSQPRQRERAARWMGETGQSRFIEPLIRLGWTETADPVRLALLQSLERLAPESSAAGLAPDTRIDDKIKAWGQWWDAQRRRTPDLKAKSSDEQSSQKAPGQR